MSDAEDPIPQSDLPTRFAAGVVMIAVALRRDLCSAAGRSALLVAAAAAVDAGRMGRHAPRRRGAGPMLGAALLAGDPARRRRISLSRRRGRSSSTAPTCSTGWLGFGAHRRARLLLGAAPAGASTMGWRLPLCRPAAPSPCSVLELGLGRRSSSGCSSSPGRPTSAPISPAARSAGRSSRRGSARTRPGPA